MEDLRAVYEALSAPLPLEGIQRTKGTETRKGYDTTGFGYQYAVNRFNEVCGLDGWGYFYTVAQAHEGAFRSGAPNWNIVAEMTIWVSDKENARTMPGSHLASDYGDALKGAITNAFKKSGAMWGVGRQAYEGTLDDDNKPPAPVSRPTQAPPRQATPVRQPDSPAPARPTQPSPSQPSLTGELAVFAEAVRELAQHKIGAGPVWSEEATDNQLEKLGQMLGDDADLLVAVFGRTELNKGEASALMERLVAVGKTQGAITSLKEAARLAVGAPA